MIVKMKALVVLDISDEVMEDIESIGPMELLRNSIKTAHLEMVDEDDNDFLEFGNQDITEGVLKFTKGEA